MSVCPICSIDGLELIAWRGKNLCGHQFCKSCIIDWMFTAKHPTCPICRDPVRESDDSDDSEEWNYSEEANEQAVQLTLGEVITTTFKQCIGTAAAAAGAFCAVEFIKRILL